MTRLWSAIVLIALVLGIIFFTPPAVFFLLEVAAVLLATHEFFSLTSRLGVEGFPIAAGVLGVLLSVCFYNDGAWLMEWGLAAGSSLFLLWLCTGRNLRAAPDRIAYTLFGVLYVAGLLSFFLLIRRWEGGGFLIFFVMLIVWLGDSAAYFVGRRFGKILLAPGISPRKTWEGAVAGLAGSLLAGAAAKFTFLTALPLKHCLIVAGVCGIIGQFGDLAESVLKRSAGVKDSSALIPGHGGVLDRIDSLMFAGPAFYLYYKYIVLASSAGQTALP